MEKLIGTNVGPYEIVGPLGAGGMGEVYRARDPRLERNVALKIISTEAIGDEQKQHRFVQEARSASALNHPNILSVYDIGTQSGVQYIVSELIEGESLRKILDFGLAKNVIPQTGGEEEHTKSVRQGGYVLCSFPVSRWLTSLLSNE